MKVLFVRNVPPSLPAVLGLQYRCQNPSIVLRIFFYFFLRGLGNEFSNLIGSLSACGLGQHFQDLGHTLRPHGLLTQSSFGLKE